MDRDAPQGALLRDAAAVVRTQLMERFARSVEGACAGRPLPPETPLRLPPALRETLVRAALLDEDGLPPAVAAYYTEHMPRLRVEQILDPHPALRLLLKHPLQRARLPRLAEALDGLFSTLSRADIVPERLLGAPTPGALLSARPTLAALYAPTLHGPGLPMLGAYPADRPLLAADLQAGRTPDEVIDLRLSGNLIHELCHGLCSEVAEGAEGTPWMLLEAAALHLGQAARPAHIFPEEPAEAVPGVSLFVLLSQGLARLFGETALWRMLLGEPLGSLMPASAAAALVRAGWEDHLRRRHPPFAADALRALDWIKLADASRAGLLLDTAPAVELLDAAARLQWAALPWWQDPVTPADEALVRRGVAALFQVNRLCPSFQTHPDEVPEATLWLDVEQSLLACAPRADGVFGEPARWLFPPSLSRRLHQRGAARVRVEGVRRRDRGAIADLLLALAFDERPLPRDMVVSWTSSPP